MPKKQFFNRLDNLFSALEEREAPQPETPVEVPPQDTQTQASTWSWECDSSGLITACSPEIFDLLGYSPDEWIGKSIYKIAIHPKSATSLKKTIHSGFFPAELETLYISSGKQWKSVKINIFSIASSNGHPVGYHGYCQVLANVEASDIPSTAPASSPKTIPFK